MILDILKFIFSSFWIWAGTVVLLGIVVDGISRAWSSLILAVQRWNS